MIRGADLRQLAVALAAVLTLGSCGGAGGAAQPSPPDLSGTWLLVPEESEAYRDRFGGEPGGAVTPEDRERMRQQVAVGLRAFRAFKLEQSDSTVTLTSAEGPTRVFYTDGRTLERRIEGLGNVRISTRWNGDKLEVKRRLADGVEIKETYQRGPDGRRLLVRFQVSGAVRSFDFKRVYELAS